MVRYLALVALVGCADVDLDSREQRILTTLADDNYEHARREPELVRMKLRKMQRTPFTWLRGTADLYWRDLGDAGATASPYADATSSRVLLIGDPHVENVGTFRASDGTMFVDWNDFDATGYGPYTGDVRRLALAWMVVTPDDSLVRAMVNGYTDTMAALSAGARIGTIGIGAAPLFDKALTKARTRGDAHFAIDELAPIVGTTRQLALGDLEAIADDGVIEDRVIAVTPEQSRWIDEALPGAAIKLRARRIGSGVASYAVLRFQVVLEGETEGEQNDQIVELKETRDGLILDMPGFASPEWKSPAMRAVNTQRRLQARPDADTLLAFADVGALSLKIRNREAYQRGINIEDLQVLDHAQQLELARLYGNLLARAHGVALTEDGVEGWRVIAPQVDAGFADAVVADANADLDQLMRDYTAMKDRDLAEYVLP